ncbi:MAG: sigma-70 family RNA polymerase sigma factor [Acidobacteriaceae bacterium]|nr:sigma-70 family RNA polymerase sigma factor [Acidobacteriaceae bacterium]
MTAMQANTSPTSAGEHHHTEPVKEKTAKTTLSTVEWSVLVEQIREGQDKGMEQLYKLFSRGIRYYLCRQLGPQELEDKVHDTFLIVVNAIQRGDLREPERLMGFVRTVVRRQVAAYIEQAVHMRREQADLETGASVADRKQNPEQEAILRQRAELMKSALSALSKRDRDILVRFYLYEQPQEQICQEMALTETQFRLLKSRAKAKFGEIGRKKLATNGILSVFVRAHAG